MPEDREEFQANITEGGEHFVSQEQRAILAIFRTAAALDHELSEILRKEGITPTQYNVLRILRGSKGQGLCRSEVGERLVSPVPDVSRLLDRMESAGYIKRTRGTEDRRYVATEITEKGLEILSKLDEPINRAHKKQVGHMSDEDLRQLTELLEKARKR